MAKFFLKRLIIYALIATFVVPTAKGAQNSSQSVSSGNILDTRVSFQVTDGEVGRVLRTLAEAFDLNIVVSEGIKGTVSLKLNNVRLEDALDLILESTGYFYKVQDNIIIIQAPEKEVVTQVFPLQYKKVSELKGGIGPLLSPQGSVEQGGDEKHIVIKEVPSKMKTVLKEIEKVDQPPYQILIEARMVEVEDTDLTAFGVTWNNNFNLAGSSNGKGPLGSRTFLPPGAASTATSTTSTESTDFRLNLPETSSDLSGGQLLYGVTYGRAHLSATIDALVRHNKAHILASPTIATTDGEEAKIIIGEKFPFRENTLTAVGTTETTKFVDIGTALRVTPRVINKDQVLLEIHPEVSSLNSALEAGPRINTREATTKIIVKNGQTVVIGGLLQNNKTVIRQKIPILGNIPILGVAFRNKSTDFITKELAVFITPYFLNPLSGDENEPVIDSFSARIFYNRAVRLMDEYGIESLGKSEAQRYSEAVANLKVVVKNFGDSEIGDAAMYQLGRLYYEKLHNPEKAAEAWKELVTRRPDSPYATEELYDLLHKAQRQAEKKEKNLKKKFT